MTLKIFLDIYSNLEYENLNRLKYFTDMFVKSKPRASAKMSEVGKDIFRKRRTKPKMPLKDVTNELEVRGDVLKEGENRPKWSRYDGNVVDERFDNVREKVRKEGGGGRDCFFRCLFDDEIFKYIILSSGYGNFHVQT